MKILIIGGSGVIGTKLVNYFKNEELETEYTYLKNKIPYYSGYQLDITKKNEIIKIISKSNPDVVIHTAALTNVDLCETNNSLANLINVKGTENVIEGCKNVNSKLIYISTSFVFDGSKETYYENDKVSPATYYGITKQHSEDLVQKSGLQYLILRTDQPYCWVEKWQRTNSVVRALRTLQSGKVLKEIVDWYNTPTFVPDFVEATRKLIDDNASGIFHLVGSDFINRYTWSLSVAEIFGLNKKMILPINSETLNLAVKRVNVHLSNQKIFEKTGIRMNGIKEGLEEMFLEFKKLEAP